MQSFETNDLIDFEKKGLKKKAFLIWEAEVSLSLATSAFLLNPWEFATKTTHLKVEILGTCQRQMRP